MNQKQVNELVEVLKERATNMDYMFIGFTEEDRSLTILGGDAERISEAMFASITTGNNKKVGDKLYEIVKDVLLNLFRANDMYRKEFVKDLMVDSVVNKKPSKK